MTIAANEHRELLKSSWAVNFKPVGEIQPAVNHRYVTLAFELPVFTKPTSYEHLRLDCLSHDSAADDSSSAGKHTLKFVCNHYQTLINNLIESRLDNDQKIQDQIHQLNEILPLEVTASSRRTRRGVGMLLFGVASGIVSIINTVDMRRRQAALKQAIQILEARSEGTSREMSDIRGDLLAVAEQASTDYEYLRTSLRNATKEMLELHNRVKQHMKYAFESLRSEMDNVYIIEQLHTSASVRTHRIFARTETSYANMREYLRIYQAGVSDILQGKLPSTLLTPSGLRAVLDNVKELLKERQPEYRLAFQSLAHYYRRLDVTYTVADGKLLVMVPILLRKHNQRRMTLYRVETCFAPFNPANLNKTGQYTRVRVSADYIAVAEENFAEISAEQLGDCENYNGLYLCDDTYVLQLYNTAHTCASSLFYDQSPEIISQHCAFEFIFQIKPPPCLLHSDKHLLLSGLGEKWSFRCKRSNVPRRITGANFAVVNVTNLCNCDLVGDQYFVAEKIDNCEDKKDDFQLYYPINAVVATVFLDKIALEGVAKNLSHLFTTPPKLNTPTISLANPMKDLDLLIPGDLSKSVNLKQLARKIRAKQALYLDGSHREFHRAKDVSSWFATLGNWSLALTFVFSLLGALALFVTGFNCLRGHKLMTMFGTLVATAPPVEGCSDRQSGDLAFGDRIADRIFQLVILISVFITYRIGRSIYLNWSAVRIALPATMAVAGGPLTHLALEFGSPLHGLVRAYLGSCHADVCGLNIRGRLAAVQLDLVTARAHTHAVLKLDWASADFRLLHDRTGLPLPRCAYIPFWKIGALRKIMTDSYAARFLATHAGLTYILTYERVVSSNLRPNDDYELLSRTGTPRSSHSDIRKRDWGHEAPYSPLQLLSNDSGRPLAAGPLALPRRANGDTADTRSVPLRANNTATGASAPPRRADRESVGASALPRRTDQDTHGALIAPRRADCDTMDAAAAPRRGPSEQRPVGEHRQVGNIPVNTVMSTGVVQTLSDFPVHVAHDGRMIVGLPGHPASYV